MRLSPHAPPARPAISPRTHLDAAAMALMVLLCAAWGLQQVAIKLTNDGISPMLQAGLRSALAAVLVWGWALLRGQPLFQRDGSLVLGIVAGLLFAGEFVGIYLGLVYTNASRSVVFLYISPFVVAIGAHLFIPGEHLRKLQVAGLLCAFAGILAAFGDALSVTTGSQLQGDLLVLGGAVLWGSTTVLIKASRLARLTPAKMLFYQLAASGITLPLLSWAVSEPGIVALTPLVVASFLYQSVGIAFVSYLAWFWLVARYPASRLTAFSFLTPLFGVLMGGLLLGEPITGGLAVAMVLVGLGIYLVNRPPAATPRHGDAVPATEATVLRAQPESAVK